MKKFICEKVQKNLLGRIQTAQHRAEVTYNPEESDAAIKTIGELERAYDDVTGLKALSRNRDLQLAKLPLTKDFKEFAHLVVLGYAGMPLRDSALSRPFAKVAGWTDEDILLFCNTLYEDENVEAFMSPLNCQFFAPKSFKTSTGTCVVYNDFLQKGSVMLLERTYTVVDLVAPATDAIKLMTFDKPYTNKTVIAEAFMHFRAIAALEKEGITTEAHKLFAQTINGMIVEAQDLYSQMSSSLEEDMDIKIKARVLKLVDMVIGLSLSQMEDMHLKDIMNSNIMLKKPNLYWTSYKEVLEDTNEMVKVKSNTRW